MHIWPSTGMKEYNKSENVEILVVNAYGLTIRTRKQAMEVETFLA